MEKKIFNNCYNKNDIDHINTLPDDLLLFIFKSNFTQLEIFLLLSLVSKRWNKVISSNKNLFFQSPYRRYYLKNKFIQIEFAKRYLNHNHFTSSLTELPNGLIAIIVKEYNFRAELLMVKKNNGEIARKIELDDVSDNHCTSFGDYMYVYNTCGTIKIYNSEGTFKHQFQLPSIPLCLKAVANEKILFASAYRNAHEEWIGEIYFVNLINETNSVEILFKYTLDRTSEGAYITDILLFNVSDKT